VLLAVNMQTSFMHPPFGFALFYLRSVAATKDYIDKQTGKLIARVTTGQIYWGAIPFVLIQIVMVGLVIAFPQMVLVYKAGESKINPNTIHIEVPVDAPSMTGKGNPANSEQEEAEKALDKAFGEPEPGAAPTPDGGTAPAPGAAGSEAGQPQPGAPPPK
jgi:hypothetical protein